MAESTSQAPQKSVTLTTEQYQRLKALAAEPRRQLSRIPLLLPLAAAFGLVSVLYGFEKILDRTALVNHPIEMIAVGIILLLVTGATAQKL